MKVLSQCKETLITLLGLGTPPLWFRSILVGSTEAPSRVFLLFPLFSDWLKSNHLKSRIKRVVFRLFTLPICSAVTETIRVTNYATSFGAKKNVQKTKFEAAEMILEMWNQQIPPKRQKIFSQNCLTSKKI